MFKLIGSVALRVLIVFIVAMMLLGFIAFATAPSLFGVVFVASSTIGAVYGWSLITAAIAAPMIYSKESKISENMEKLSDEYDIDLGESVNEKEQKSVIRYIKRIIAKEM